jgi:hypothetical protein
LSQRLLATALRAHDLVVYIRADVFPSGVSDAEWLQEVGRQGWIALTKDKAIRRRTNELTALLNAGVRAFVLAAGEMTGQEQADLFVRLIPKIRWFVAEQGPPFVVRIEKSGRTELIATR